MCTAKIIQLPSANEPKVAQTRTRGRLPNSVVRLHVVRYERRQLDRDAEYIQEKIEGFERQVECIEEVLTNTKDKLSKLLTVRPGSPAVSRLREYDNLLAGREPAEWPL